MVTHWSSHVRFLGVFISSYGLSSNYGTVVHCVVVLIPALAVKYSSQVKPQRAQKPSQEFAKNVVCIALCCWNAE